MKYLSEVDEKTMSVEWEHVSGGKHWQTFKSFTEMYNAIDENAQEVMEYEVEQILLKRIGKFVSLNQIKKRNPNKRIDFTKVSKLIFLHNSKTTKERTESTSNIMFMALKKAGLK